jgi:hypothetical protein
MLKKLFNYLAQAPQSQYTLGSLFSTKDGSAPPLSIDLNRAGRLTERVVTISGIFLGVAAFAAAPALTAFPALIGTATLSKCAGFATGFLTDVGIRRAAGLG